MLHTQGETGGDIFEEFVQVEFLFLERSCLTVEHRHLQHLLHEETEALGLVVDDTAKMLEHGGRLFDAIVVQHLSCQRDARYRGFQLVRHIVDEVVLDLRIAFLTEDDHNRKHEGDKQHDGEDHRRNHKPHTRENVGVHVGEMDLHNTHFR